MNPDEEEDIPVSITNELEQRIVDAFEVFDQFDNKIIAAEHVGSVVRALGCCPTEAELVQIIIGVQDLVSPERVHLSKFLPYVSQLITEHKYKPASAAKLLDAFHKLDPEGHGYVPKEYFSELMMTVGEPFSQDELEEMLETALDPRTQTINYEHYVNQLLNQVPDKDNMFILADKIEAAKPPPPPPPKRFSEIMAEMQKGLG